MAQLGGKPSPLAGASIERITGVPAREVTTARLDRANGDTPAFRAANLSKRWWWFYWKAFGAPSTWRG